ncbi:diguanylate cyclase [Vibrio ponticus]|nr:diguanylate cyclase [Vibrio ponticus]
MKTLIIEDDYPQALYLKMLLQDLGYKDIAIASNLESIHNATASTQYDLIFTDIRMPEADGITLLSKKLTPHTTKGVVIVSIVEDSIKELTKGMCHQLGYEYTSILSKPFDVEKLSLELELFLSHVAETKQTEDEFKPKAEDVLSAFQNHSVVPLYQPQFSFSRAELVGVEALARLNHPEHGMLVPSQFLPVLSEHNLLLELYYLILERSTLDLSAILSPPQLSLNIDTDFLDTEFCEKTVEICQRNGFPLENLTLEITEHKAFLPTPTILENLARLNLYGVRFSIDDFGTGYASLDQLIDLPISELKIDRRFVSNVVTNYKHQQLTLAALRLAQALGLSCVAEGIEDQATWEYLKELGVDICQGFYTGAPMSFLELASLHRAVSGEATSWSKEEQYDTIILFDQLQLRGKAIQKLLAKELPLNLSCWHQTQVYLPSYSMKHQIAL